MKYSLRSLLALTAVVALVVCCVVAFTPSRPAIPDSVGMQLTEHQVAMLRERYGLTVKIDESKSVTYSNIRKTCEIEFFNNTPVRISLAYPVDRSLKIGPFPKNLAVGTIDMNEKEYESLDDGHGRVGVVVIRPAADVRREIFGNISYTVQAPTSFQEPASNAEYTLQSPPVDQRK